MMSMMSLRHGEYRMLNPRPAVQNRGAREIGRVNRGGPRCKHAGVLLNAPSFRLSVLWAAVVLQSDNAEGTKIGLVCETLRGLMS